MKHDDGGADGEANEEDDNDVACLHHGPREDRLEHLPPKLIPFWIEIFNSLSKLQETRNGLDPGVGRQGCDGEPSAVLVVDDQARRGPGEHQDEVAQDCHAGE